MKPLLLIFTLVLLHLFETDARAAENDAIAAVIAAEKARGAALLAADMKALGKIMADDFKYTHSNGMLETRQIHLESFKKGLRYQKFETSQIAGHVITPEVVVLNGVIDQRKGSGEKWTDYHLLFHSVWRKKGTAWELASLQTALPPGK